MWNLVKPLILYILTWSARQKVWMFHFVWLPSLHFKIFSAEVPWCFCVAHFVWHPSKASVMNGYTLNGFSPWLAAAYFLGLYNTCFFLLQSSVTTSLISIICFCHNFASAPLLTPVVYFWQSPYFTSLFLSFPYSSIPLLPFSLIQILG